MCTNPTRNLLSNSLVLAFACHMCMGRKFLEQVYQEKYIHPNTHSSTIYSTVIHPCPRFLRHCTTNITSTQNPSTYASSFLCKCTAKYTSTLIVLKSIQHSSIYGIRIVGDRVREVFEALVANCR